MVFLLALFLFSSGTFFLTPSGVQAGFLDIAADMGNAAIDTALWPVKAIIYYMVFVPVGFFTSVAITIFEWAINPNYISGDGGLLNRPGVYDLWKFIRDFFNLFFILTLLYTAFTIVFQVAKDYKKTLLSLVLAALFVNFSFPITRVIIDVTNVPMYYFVNQMGANGSGKDLLGTFLSASQMKQILVPNSLSSTSMSSLLMATVFLFLFTITLLVLAILLVVRLVALIVLLIFSSVGFAASVIPGMQKFSGQWWDNLARYALFGPASMLMLLVATRFFAEINQGDVIVQFWQTAATNSTPDSAGIISAMAMFSVPIIMMWFAIGLSSSMSIAGAGVVVGQAEKFSKWAGKKTYNNSITRGFGSGAKDRFQGTSVGRWLKSPSTTEARIKGWTKKTSNFVNPWNASGQAGARTELQKLKDKQIHEQIGKDKENKLSQTDAINRLNSTDDVMRISAATSLANMDNGIQNMDHLNKALDALKDIDPATGKRTVLNKNYTEKAVEIIAKADKKIIADTPGVPATATSPAIAPKKGLENLTAVIGSLDKNEKAITDLISKLDDSAFSGSGAQYDRLNSVLSATGIPNLVATLKAKAIKEGAGHVLAEDLVDRGVTPDAAVDAVLGDMKAAKDVVKSVKLFTDPRFSTAARNYVVSLRTSSPDRYLEIKKAAAQESPEVASRI